MDSFDRNLWPNLPHLVQYNRQAVNKLQAFNKLATSINLMVKRLADGLRKATTELEDDFGKSQVKDYDDQEDTLSLAIQCVKSGIDTLS